MSREKAAAVLSNRFITLDLCRAVVDEVSYFTNLEMCAVVSKDYLSRTLIN